MKDRHLLVLFVLLTSWGCKTELPAPILLDQSLEQYINGDWELYTVCTTYPGGKKCGNKTPISKRWIFDKTLTRNNPGHCTHSYQVQGHLILLEDQTFHVFATGQRMVSYSLDSTRIYSKRVDFIILREIQSEMHIQDITLIRP